MTEHSGSTDSVHNAKLASAIQRVSWLARQARAGGPAPLEILTLFVGDGSDLTIEVRTKSGKAIGKVEEQIGQNRYQGDFLIPEGTKDEIYFEALLPKHGLKERSKLLQVLPHISITNAKWDRKEARRGDVLELSADVKGAADETEAKITIYEHDADGAHDPVVELSELVKNEQLVADWEFEYFEDTDDIPAAEESEKGYNPPEYFFRVSVHGVSADSELLRFKDWIEIEVTDESGNPFSGQEYVLHLADGQERRGKLDDQGCALEEDIPPGPCEIECQVEDDDDGETGDDGDDVPEESS